MYVSQAAVDFRRLKRRPRLFYFRRVSSHSPRTIAHRIRAHQLIVGICYLWQTDDKSTIYRRKPCSYPYPSHPTRKSCRIIASSTLHLANSQWRYVFWVRRKKVDGGGQFELPHINLIWGEWNQVWTSKREKRMGFSRKLECPILQCSILPFVTSYGQMRQFGDIHFGLNDQLGQSGQEFRTEWSAIPYFNYESAPEYACGDMATCISGFSIAWRGPGIRCGRKAPHAPRSVIPTGRLIRLTHVSVPDLFYDRAVTNRPEWVVRIVLKSPIGEPPTSLTDSLRESWDVSYFKAVS